VTGVKSPQILGKKETTKSRARKEMSDDFEIDFVDGE
jgi:hypothetical protein